MTDSKEVPKIKDEKKPKNKNLFKRFKINLEDFKIEKSDFDEKFSDDKYDKKDNHAQDNDNESLKKKNTPINNFEGEDDLIFKDNENKKNFKGHSDNSENKNQKLSHIKENKIVIEKFPLFTKIKEINFEIQGKKLPILAILGLAIGILLIMTGTSMLLGSSDKVVDNVVSGETSASSVLIISIGIIFLVLSLLKIFPNEKTFGNIFHIINDFETEINNNDEDTKNNKTNPQPKDEDLIIKKADINSIEN
ncbi:MAG: hypothetical protein LBU74_00930 [Methanobacteriaceae archaeon]|jgi:hypothetical protein|nr:hypothetical protein [Candidatus Methanorudis spinitermitis]